MQLECNRLHNIVSASVNWKSFLAATNGVATTTVHFCSNNSSPNTRGKPVRKATNTSLNSDTASVFTISYPIRLATSTMAVAISVECFDKDIYGSDKFFLSS